MNCWGGGLINDTTPPIVTLSKKTYIEGFDGWIFDNNAYVDDDGILIMGANGENARVRSNYYNVDGEFWYTEFDGYTTNQKKGAFWNAFYYDNNMNQAKTIEGNISNGFAVYVPLNDWKNNIVWQNNYNSITSASAIASPRYGPNVKKVQFEFFVGTNNYSGPTLKLRNFKVYGQMTNSFYLINVDATDDTSIKTIKYEYGNKDKKYFKNSGAFVKNNQFRVTKNGIYTVYVSDVYRNETISTITIDKIN